MTAARNTLCQFCATSGLLRIEKIGTWPDCRLATKFGQAPHQDQLIEARSNYGLLSRTEDVRSSMSTMRERCRNNPNIRVLPRRGLKPVVLPVRTLNFPRQTLTGQRAALKNSRA